MTTPPIQAYFDLTEPLLKKFVFTAAKAGEVAAIVNAARAALAAPLPEPVAWLRADGEEGSLSTMVACITDRVKKVWLGANPTQVERYTIPLYTAPIAAAQEALAPEGNAPLDYTGSNAPVNAPMAPPVAAAAPLPQPPAWIPVSERPPQLRAPVVLLTLNRFENCGHDRNVQATGYLEEYHAGSQFWSTARCSETLESYTHWMPLPPPPGTESDLTARPAKNAAAQEHDRMPSALGSTGAGQTDDGALASGQGMRARNAEGSPPVAAAPIEARPVPTPSVEQDAKRYRWLKATAPYQLCSIAWRIKAACADEVANDPDQAIDAALGAAPQAPEPGEA